MGWNLGRRLLIVLVVLAGGVAIGAYGGSQNPMRYVANARSGLAPATALTPPVESYAVYGDPGHVFAGAIAGFLVAALALSVAYAAGQSYRTIRSSGASTDT